ncbi:hypothetical protein FH972_021030 [Carpinus fangiana]|uniref:Major facilitator superfamily (MFS) profile domain-containing protein n=1 Tax=Carpinus fangiana TaxID=176857 RepID=A0A5N6KN83_9ROSI|nr:hypothetical protein FH972_021030 [Carpinus fangiana]
MSPNTTLVLVPGAWHSPASYAPLIAVLKTPPYASLFTTVTAVALPSVDSRPRGQTSWAADVAAVRAALVAAIDTGDDVWLLMHSYGGAPGTEAVQGLTRTERAARGASGGVVHLVYMAAFPLAEGESLLSRAPGGRRAPWVADSGLDDGNSVVPGPTAREVFYHDVTDEAVLKRLEREIGSHSEASFLSTATYAAWREVPSLYLLCERDRAFPAVAQEAYIAQKEGWMEGVGGWRVVRLDSGHFPVLNMPERVAEELAEEQRHALSVHSGRDDKARPPEHSLSRHIIHHDRIEHDLFVKHLHRGWATVLVEAKIVTGTLSRAWPRGLILLEPLLRCNKTSTKDARPAALKLVERRICGNSTGASLYISSALPPACHARPAIGNRGTGATSDWYVDSFVGSLSKSHAAQDRGDTNFASVRVYATLCRLYSALCPRPAVHCFATFKPPPCPSARGYIFQTSCDAHRYDRPLSPRPRPSVAPTGPAQAHTYTRLWSFWGPSPHSPTSHRPLASWPPTIPRRRRRIPALDPIRVLRLLNTQQWLFFLVAFCGWTWDAFDFFTVTLTVEQMAETFGRPKADITWGITLVLMLRSVGAIGFGLWADRYGRKWPYVVNLALFVVLELATGFCQTYQQFLGVRAVYGIAMGGLYGNAAATALEDCPEEARGLISGMLQQGYAFGFLLATAFARAFVDTTRHGWRPLYWFGAGPPVLIIIFRLCLPETNTFIERQRIREAGDNVGKTFVKEGKVALKKHWMILVYLVLLMAGFNFMSHGSQDLYPTMLTNQYNFTPDQLTVTQVVANLGAMTGGTIIGYLSQSLGRRFSIIFISIIGGALLYPYTFVDDTKIIAPAFFEQFCVQGAWGVIPIHLMELSPGSFRTFVVGTSYQLGNLASSASSTIEATIGERFPLPPKVAADGKVTQRYQYGRVICIFMGCVFAYVILLTLIGPEARGHRMDASSDSDLAEATGAEAINRVVGKGSHASDSSDEEKSEHVKTTDRLA